MVSAVIILITSIVLLVQCLGFYELIPLLSFSFMSNKSLFMYYIHACVCKWGLPFAVVGIVLSLLVLTDKENKNSMREHLKGYAIVFILLALLSIV